MVVRDRGAGWLDALVMYPVIFTTFTMAVAAYASRSLPALRS